jgi:gamma-glutamyl-gamma-aminobutyrate hydrolase PuuD
VDRKPPLIGVTAYEMSVDFSHWSGVRSVLVPTSYVHRIADAGGQPLVVPPRAGGADEIAGAIHGLVLSGGPDLNPSLYGEAPHAESGDFHDERDRAEAELLAAAIARDMPVLGICRGMQLMNVLAGGGLHQHLPELTDEAHKTRGAFVRHDVSIEPGGRLAGLLGERVHVHSSHHQAPAAVAPGLVVQAHASDGTIEAFEHPGRRFCLGVLWHPEEDEDGAAPLFEELVRQARIYREERR